MKNLLIGLLASVAFVGGIGTVVMMNSNETLDVKPEALEKETNLPTIEEDIITEDVQTEEAEVVMPENEVTEDVVEVLEEETQTYSLQTENTDKEEIKQEVPVQPSTPTPAPEPVKPVTPPASSSSDFMSQVEQLIFAKVNEERANAGVATLSYNNTMQKYARIKSEDMGVNNYFDHKDLNGQLITNQMAADGVSYAAWGENIAYIGGVSDANALANQFMTNWMNSQGHRENILSDNFTGIGIGVYKVGGTVYATQEFLR
ncbi:MAG: CAP domain-containing protein [Turicibacter sp.]